jgi:glycosyltransferase involved in cell wall biosynthesis
MIRILALVPKPKGLSPGQRFRLEQWAPVLEDKHGIRIDFAPFESSELAAILYQQGKRAEKAYWMLRAMWRRREVLEKARGYDGVIVYREAAALGPPIFERLLKRAKIPLFLDIDDAVWLEGGGGGPNGVFSHLRFAPTKTSTLCRIADGVVVGNEYLAAYARERRSGSDGVFVVPTTIDLTRYPVVPAAPERDVFVIGWSGSFSTLRHLEGARAAIERLAKKRRVQVRVVCNKAPERPFEGTDTQFVPWTEKGEAEELARVDVGMMPLPDDAQARGKCGLKALQYMAVGRPVLVSPVGVNTVIVRDGENGFVPRSTQEWVDRFDQLAASRDLRVKLGAAARRTIEDAYSSEVGAAKIADAFRKVLGKPADGREAPRPRASEKAGVTLGLAK